MQEQNFQRIEFEGLPNTRDLGGITTREGKRVVSKKLLRSGSLNPATKQDAQMLLDDYNLQTVIDLRTEEEKEGSPDPVDLFPGIQFMQVPLLQVQSLGITRSSSSSDLLQELQGLMKNPIELMIVIYPKILLDEDSQKGIKQFFDELLNAEEGSVLWHCSAGKDRVGLTTALLLTALDVPHETIAKDYLATNRYMDTLTQKTLQKIPHFMQSEQMREALKVMNSADIRFLRSALNAVTINYGGAEEYLEEAIGLTEDAIKGLRQKYLER